MPVSPPTGVVTGSLGGTAFWETTFFDINGNVTQPNGAAINVAYYVNKQPVQAIVPMSPPSTSNSQWTAEWDTRGVDAGRVFWFLYTTGGLPKGVSTGSFMLLANNATLTSF